MKRGRFLCHLVKELPQALSALRSGSYDLIQNLAGLLKADQILDFKSDDWT